MVISLKIMRKGNPVEAGTLRRYNRRSEAEKGGIKLQAQWYIGC